MGQRIKATINDQELAFEIVERSVDLAAKCAWHIDPNFGVIEKCGIPNVHTYDNRVLRLRLIHTLHVYPGLTLEDTGEQRIPVAGDWYFIDSGGDSPPIPYGDWTTDHPRIILRLLVSDEE